MKNILPDKVLMCSPKYFEVNYSGNEFMKGNIGNTDKDKALLQWSNLKSIYENLGYSVVLINPAENLVDMVFTANQSLPFIDENSAKNVVLSKMKNEQRRNEVMFFKEFYENNGYKVHELSDSIMYFESEGDCVIDYERRILFGGYGFRTQENVYDILKKITGFNVVKLKLVNPVLYHLDTCLSVLNSNTAVIAKSAFDESGLNALKSSFENIILADENENMNYFVCNCHCPDGKNVIVQKGSSIFKKDVIKNGFNLIEVETGEFMKSGGSVFCMKLMIY